MPPLNEAGRRLLDTHAELLERWRRAMNLVGPGPIDVHYTDARYALERFEPTEGRWVDLGTGAGFPGIVFAALHPALPLDLVDSRMKRCRFLDEVLAQADWSGVNVRCMRHEGLEPNHYAGVMSRALHAPERMVDVARRLVIPGGTLLLFLQDDAEVPTADDVQTVHEHRYRVDGKARKLVALQFST